MHRATNTGQPDKASQEEAMSNDDFELDFDEETGIEQEQVNDGDVQGTGEQGPAAEELVAATTETPEAPAGETSDEDKAKAEAAAKAEAEEKAAEESLEKFKAAALATLTHEDRDQATGELPVVLVQGVLDAYGEVPGAKWKAQAKSFLTDKMQELMVEGAERPDAFFEARTIMSLSKAIADTKSSKATNTVARPKVDPTEAHAERIAAMMLAPSLVTVPSDVKEDWAAKAQALATSLEADVRKYADWLAKKDEPVAEGESAPEAPEVSPVVVAAAKIAAGRAAGVRKASTGTSSPRPSTAGSGHRGDIGKHIREAFNTVEVGTFMSIADIAKAVTSEYGGDKPAPSQGAIAARLFPGGDKSKCNLDFVSPEGKDEGHPHKGGVRTA